MKYRYLNKEKLLAFGVYPEISLSDAREKCLVARRTLDENIDPSQAKKQRKRDAKVNADNTFKAIALEWHALKSENWSKITLTKS